MKLRPEDFPQEDVFTEILEKALKLNGLQEYATSSNLNKFYKLSFFLVSENIKYNLTAVTDPAGIAVLHIADSLKIAGLPLINSNMADIGSGAGFPSLPVAIVRPDLDVTAIDATQKKVDYINKAAELLELKNIIGVCGRAESLFKASDATLRESFNFVTARGVASLGILSELCAPAVTVNGTFAAMKGANISKELPTNLDYSKKLGIELIKTEEYSLVGFNESFDRALTIFKKTEGSNHLYPRDFSKIQKRPLF